MTVVRYRILPVQIQFWIFVVHFPRIYVRGNNTLGFFYTLVLIIRAGVESVDSIPVQVEPINAFAMGFEMIRIGYKENESLGI